MYTGLAKVASNNQNIANEIENSNSRHDYFTIAIRDYRLEWQALGLRYYLEGQTWNPSGLVLTGCCDMYNRNADEFVLCKDYYLFTAWEERSNQRGYAGVKNEPEITRST